MTTEKVNLLSVNQWKTFVWCSIPFHFTYMFVATELGQILIEVNVIVLFEIICGIREAKQNDDEEGKR